LANRFKELNWEVTTTSHKTRKIPRLLDMLRTTYVSRFKYDIALVEVFSGPSFVWAEWVCWLLRRLQKPFVLTLHGGNLPAFAKRWPGRVRRLLNSATVVTTPSRYLQKALRSYRNDLLLLPNAIDLASYPFKLRTNPQPKFVWLRAFHEIYNPTMAPRVVAHLLEMGDLGSPTSDLRPPTSDLHLTMYGPDKGDGSLDQVKSEVRRLNLEGRVSMPGAVPKTGVPKALNSGDIFLNTTNHESFGVSVMEAAACGLCIVSTNVGELPLLWQDGHDALLVQPADAKAMAGAVRRILTGPGLAERLSRNARFKAEQFDWSVILPLWERVLNNVACSGNSLRKTPNHCSSSSRSLQ
jgi:glycosyltransferase involved in cell wall biosynthesis